MRRIINALVTALAVAVVLAHSADGQTPGWGTEPGMVAVNAPSWRWSPVAAHHRAAVRVNSAGNAGSGVYVQLGSLRGVMTAAHVIGGQTATVTWFDGKADMGECTSDKFGHDIAWISLKAPRGDVRALTLAARDPRPGERLEVLGFAGREGRLRHYWSSVIRDSGGNLYSEADPSPGDSGGAILLSAPGPSVVSVVSGGENDLGDRVDNWPVYRGLVCASPGPVRNFASRLVQRFGECPPGGCPPGGCPPYQQPDPQQFGGGLYPPQQSLPPYDAPPSPSPTPGGNQIGGCQCDPSKYATKEDFESLRSQFEGLAGVMQPQLDKMVSTVARIDSTLAMIEKSPGPPGPQGPPGPAGTGPSIEDVLSQLGNRQSRHYVLVAREGADYWPRVYERFGRARGTYAGLRHAPPPVRYTGVLPRLVVFVAGTPSGEAVGVRAVTDALQQLSLGQVPEL